eukprot:3537561-Pyramimonas_sp.AAC.1
MAARSQSPLGRSRRRVAARRSARQAALRLPAETLEAAVEGGGSEIEATWDSPSDPQDNGMLKRIDHTGRELGEVEKKLLTEGGYL